MSARASVLVLRPDNIGDTIIFSGALRVLRDHWRNARIDYWVQPHIRPFVAHCPHVDAVRSVRRLEPWIAIRRFLLRGTWGLERALTNSMVSRFWLPRYDWVIYPASAPVEQYLRIVRLMRARHKWGYGGEQLAIEELVDSRNRPELVFDRLFENTPDNRWMHDAERTAGFLAAMGVEASGPPRPELWLTQDDRKFAETRVPPGSIGFFVGATSHWRQWPADKWVELLCRQAPSRRVVLLGGADGRLPADAILQAVGQRGMGLELLDMVGRTSLREAAAVIETLDLLVSNDSAGLHMAVAAGIPAVGIMGGYHFGRFYPWGNPSIHRTAALNMPCFHCNNHCIYGDFRCVSDIPVDMVAGEMQLALEAGRQKSHS